MDTKQAKQRFGIIGNTPQLERAIDVALQVAPTDISILVFDNKLEESAISVRELLLLFSSKEKHKNLFVFD